MPDLGKPKMKIRLSPLLPRALSKLKSLKYFFILSNFFNSKLKLYSSNVLNFVSFALRVYSAYFFIFF